MNYTPIQLEQAAIGAVTEHIENVLIENGYNVSDAEDISNALAIPMLKFIAEIHLLSLDFHSETDDIKYEN